MLDLFQCVGSWKNWFGTADTTSATLFMLSGGGCGMMTGGDPAEEDDDPGYTVVLPPRQSGGHEGACGNVAEGGRGCGECSCCGQGGVGWNEVVARGRESSTGGQHRQLSAYCTPGMPSTSTAWCGEPGSEPGGLPASNSKRRSYADSVQYPTPTLPPCSSFPLRHGQGCCQIGVPDRKAHEEALSDLTEKIKAKMKEYKSVVGEKPPKRSLSSLDHQAIHASLERNNVTTFYGVRQRLVYCRHQLKQCFLELNKYTGVIDDLVKQIKQQDEVSNQLSAEMLYTDEVLLKKTIAKQEEAFLRKTFPNMRDEKACVSHLDKLKRNLKKMPEYKESVEIRKVLMAQKRKKQEERQEMHNRIEQTKLKRDNFLKPQYDALDKRRSSLSDEIDKLKRDKENLRINYEQQVQNYKRSPDAKNQLRLRRLHRTSDDAGRLPSGSGLGTSPNRASLPSESSSIPFSSYDAQSVPSTPTAPKSVFSTNSWCGLLSGWSGFRGRGVAADEAETVEANRVGEASNRTDSLPKVQYTARGGRIATNFGRWQPADDAYDFEPFAHEKQVCSMLISYFQKHRPEPDGSPEREEAARDRHPPSLSKTSSSGSGTNDLRDDGLQILRKKTDSMGDEELAGHSKSPKQAAQLKKKNSKKDKKRMNQSVTLGPVMINQLDWLGVEVPHTVADIPATVEALQEKLKYYEDQVNVGTRSSSLWDVSSSSLYDYSFSISGSEATDSALASFTQSLSSLNSADNAGSMMMIGGYSAGSSRAPPYGGRRSYAGRVERAGSMAASPSSASDLEPYGQYDSPRVVSPSYAGSFSSRSNLAQGLLVEKDEGQDIPDGAGHQRPVQDRLHSTPVRPLPGDAHLAGGGSTSLGNMLSLSFDDSTCVTTSVQVEKNSHDCKLSGSDLDFIPRDGHVNVPTTDSEGSMADDGVNSQTPVVNPATEQVPFITDFDTNLSVTGRASKDDNDASIIPPPPNLVGRSFSEGTTSTDNQSVDQLTGVMVTLATVEPSVTTSNDGTLALGGGPNLETNPLGTTMTFAQGDLLEAQTIIRSSSGSNSFVQVVRSKDEGFDDDMTDAGGVSHSNEFSNGSNGGFDKAPTSGNISHIVSNAIRDIRERHGTSSSGSGVSGDENTIN